MRDGLRVSDITLDGVDLGTETGSDRVRYLDGLGPVLNSYLVSGPAADLTGRLLQDVQLPEPNKQNLRTGRNGTSC